jgi:hypothetical protein
MREGLMKTDEMDEPHPYQTYIFYSQMDMKNFSYPLGNLDYKPDILQMIRKAGVPQLVNEYGWIWLWRNGLPSKLTVDTYNYYLGANSTPKQNREFQAYLLELETEWLRSEPGIAGVLAFCYLANNYGYTGDWFTGKINDLTPAPALEWFADAFAPSAVFINLTDERYVKQAIPHTPGEKLTFKLAKVNDLSENISGKVTLRILNSDGKVVSKKVIPVVLSAFDRSALSTEVTLPGKPGGYLLTAEFNAEASSKSVLSRRFIKVGKLPEYKFFEIQPPQLK